MKLCIIPNDIFPYNSTLSSEKKNLMSTMLFISKTIENLSNLYNGKMVNDSFNVGMITHEYFFFLL